MTGKNKILPKNDRKFLNISQIDFRLETKNRKFLTLPAQIFHNFFYQPCRIFKILQALKAKVR